ncbi:MAG: zinc ABC transporter substrate-binding protein, partial [Muribaculaceae bacterium]|nr:zinc ABC transporter substrate-binding protein [Muribaculaceae bacterium]
MAERIGGDSVTVECLLPSGADPEEFDPGTKALRQLSRSEIYFSTGTLPFEHKLVSGFREHLPD